MTQDASLNSGADRRPEGMFMKARTRGFWLLVVVGAVCGLLIFYHFFMQGMIASMMAGQQRPAIEVSAVAAKAGPWTPGIEAVGTAKAGLGADVAVEAPGVVKAIAFVANQKATAGQLLVQIDDSVEQADSHRRRGQHQAGAVRGRPYPGAGEARRIAPGDARQRHSHQRDGARHLCPPESRT
ncbi:MAG: hypothetical protein QM698_17290 [Micropepsaceae bacterium]